VSVKLDEWCLYRENWGELSVNKPCMQRSVGDQGNGRVVGCWPKFNALYISFLPLARKRSILQNRFFPFF
jgi:hypothetical protein